VDEFLITTNPAPEAAPDGNGVSADPQPIQLQVTREQPLQPDMKMKIGPFFEVELKTANQATMQIGMVGGLALAALMVVRVRGAGKSTFTLFNAWRKKSETEDAVASSDPVTIDVPEGADVSGGLTYLEIIAEAVPDSGMVDEWMKDHASLFSPVTDKHRQVLAAAAARR
jgi:hypothetical protein